MKLNHILLSAAILASAIFSPQSSAKSSLINCEGYCYNGSLKSRVAKDYGASQNSRPSEELNKVYFYNPELETTEYYNVISDYDREFYRTFVFTRGPYTSSEEIASLVKLAFQGINDIFQIFDLEHPPTSTGMNIISGLNVYAGTDIGYFGFSQNHNIELIRRVGGSSWTAGMSTELLIWLANSSGQTVSQVVSALNNNIATIQSQLEGTFGVDADVVNAEVGASVTTTISAMATQVRLVLSDGYVQFKWNPLTQSFDIVVMKDSLGQDIPIDKNGNFKESLLPERLTLSEDNIQVWQTVSEFINSVWLRNATTSYRNGIVIITRQK